MIYFISPVFCFSQNSIRYLRTDFSDPKYPKLTTELQFTNNESIYYSVINNTLLFDNPNLFIEYPQILDTIIRTKLDSTSLIAVRHTLKKTAIVLKRTHLY